MTVGVLPECANGQVYGVSIAITTADLTYIAQPDTVCQRLCAEPPVDLLVNNAGAGLLGDFMTAAAVEMRKLLALNVSGPTLPASVAIGGMVAHGSGAIINIAPCWHSWKMLACLLVEMPRFGRIRAPCQCPNCWLFFRSIARPSHRQRPGSGLPLPAPARRRVSRPRAAAAGRCGQRRSRRGN